MTVIEQIRRHTLKVSQTALATAAGVSQSTVSRWERGECSPSLDELTKIREIYPKVPAGAFLDPSLLPPTPGAA